MDADHPMRKRNSRGNKDGAVKRRDLTMSSELGPASVLGVIGSSAMPQIGRAPAPSRTISAYVGHVHFTPAGTAVGSPCLGVRSCACACVVLARLSAWR